MKTFLKTFLLLVITLSLVVTLLSCTKQEAVDEDESWIENGTGPEGKTNRATSAKGGDQSALPKNNGDEGAPSGGKTVTTTVIPLD